MKKILIWITAPVLLLLFLMATEQDQVIGPAVDPVPMQFTSYHEGPADHVPSDKDARPEAHMEQESEQNGWYAASEAEDADPLIAYALSLIGSPYVFGGKSSSGFDCSGFTSHVFEEFDVPITRSSTTQSQDGVAVDRNEARPGDLVIFTGTNPGVREPGHVGIVISEPGDPISFVHSSSNGGVKISQVEGTGYDGRFLGIRRLL